MVAVPLSSDSRWNVSRRSLGHEHAMPRGEKYEFFGGVLPFPFDEPSTSQKVSNAPTLEAVDSLREAYASAASVWNSSLTWMLGHGAKHSIQPDSRSAHHLSKAGLRRFR